MFSGSAKVDFANNSTFHDYSIFLLVQVQVTNSFRRILTPALTPQAQQMITQGNFAQFFNDFGDTFISGMSTGGEYIVVLEVHTYSESDQQNLTAQLNASGGLGAFSGSLSAQFSNSINSMGQSHSLQFHSFQEGGDTSQVTDADQIVAKGNAFPLTGPAISLFHTQCCRRTTLFSAFNYPTRPNLPTSERASQTCGINAICSHSY